MFDVNVNCDQYPRDLMHGYAGVKVFLLKWPLSVGITVNKEAHS